MSLLAIKYTVSKRVCVGRWTGQHRVSLWVSLTSCLNTYLCIGYYLGKALSQSQRLADEGILNGHSQSIHLQLVLPNLGYGTCKCALIESIIQRSQLNLEILRITWLRNDGSFWFRIFHDVSIKDEVSISHVNLFCVYTALCRNN